VAVQHVAVQECCAKGAQPGQFTNVKIRQQGCMPAEQSWVRIEERINTCMWGVVDPPDLQNW